MNCCNTNPQRIGWLLTAGWLALQATALNAAEPQRLTQDGALKLAPVFLKKGTEVKIGRAHV